MDKLWFENEIIELVNYADRLNAALNDCGQWYFDVLDESSDEKLFKYYFDAAKVRKEIAEDYALKIEQLAKRLDAEFVKVLRGEKEPAIIKQ